MGTKRRLDAFGPEAGTFVAGVGVELGPATTVGVGKAEPEAVVVVAVAGVVVTVGMLTSLVNCPEEAAKASAAASAKIGSVVAGVEAPVVARVEATVTVGEVAEVEAAGSVVVAVVAKAACLARSATN